MQIVWALDYERYVSLDDPRIDTLGAAWITTFFRTQETGMQRHTDRLHYEYAGYGHGPPSHAIRF